MVKQKQTNDYKIRRQEELLSFQIHVTSVGRLEQNTFAMTDSALLKG